jgi:hypothetical protein
MRCKRCGKSQRLRWSPTPTPRIQALLCAHVLADPALRESGEMFPDMGSSAVWAACSRFIRAFRNKEQNAINVEKESQLLLAELPTPSRIKGLWGSHANIQNRAPRSGQGQGIGRKVEISEGSNSGS